MFPVSQPTVSMSAAHALSLKNKKNNRYLIIGIGYLILFFIVLTPDINNAVGRGIQALLFCVLGYRCEENIRRFIKNR